MSFLWTEDVTHLFSCSGRGERGIERQLFARKTDRRNRFLPALKEDSFSLPDHFHAKLHVSNFAVSVPDGWCKWAGGIEWVHSFRSGKTSNKDKKEAKKEKVSISFTVEKVTSKGQQKIMLRLLVELPEDFEIRDNLEAAQLNKCNKQKKRQIRYSFQ